MMKAMALFPRKKASLVFISLLISIFIAAWLLQGQLFLNWDASWLMHAAQRMLAGGTYQEDFFETNPPLIFYLYLPPIYIHLLSAWSLAICFRLYIFLLAALSLGLCYQQAERIFSKENQRLVYWLVGSLAVIDLVLPLHELGQRDHLFVLLTLPYFLSLVYRLHQREKPPLAILIGLLAGIGFALKPHFLITLLLLESYAAYKQSIFFWWRAELLTLILFILGNCLGTLIFYPDYIYFMIPYAMRLYYTSISAPWSVIVFYPLALFCASPLLLCIPLMPKVRSERLLTTILLLALSGAVFSYLSQRTAFYYHLIPAFSLASLLVLLFFYFFCTQTIHRQKTDYGFMVLLALFLFSLPLLGWYQIYQTWGNHHKNVRPLTAFVHQYAQHQTVYYFVSTIIYTFPSLDSANAKLGSRFPFLWMIAGLVNHPETNPLWPQEKQLLMQMICEDFAKYKPQLVFVDISKHKPYITAADFDYLPYFLADPQFKASWRHYHYLTTLEKDNLYHFAVYQRIYPGKRLQARQSG